MNTMGSLDTNNNFIYDMTAGEDYVVFDGTVSFPAQSEPRDVVCLNISIVVDDDRENDETIELLLTSQDTNVDPEASATTVIIEEGDL